MREAGLEIGFVDPVLQVSDPKGSDLFEGGGLVIWLLRGAPSLSLLLHAANHLLLLLSCGRFDFSLVIATATIKREERRGPSFTILYV